MLLPAAENDRETFDNIVTAVAQAARENINQEVVVSGLHPSSPTKNAQAPVPSIMLFLDDENLLVEGGSMGDMADFL